MANACQNLISNDIPGIYKKRKPATTVLYKIVRENLETFLSEVREANPDSEPIPSYVEKEFYKYLDCGIMSKGFARIFCTECKSDYLVAFSCRSKCVCPSCNAKRMVQTAAHLTDYVFPKLPVRQWVLSVPKRIRYFLHNNKKVASDVCKIFLRALTIQLRDSSPLAPVKVQLGAVSFPQRFGNTLNLNYHFHFCVVDGVFAADNKGEAVFYEAVGFEPDNISAFTEKVRKRIISYLVRHDYLSEYDAENMLEWEYNGGFSVDASVRIESYDRAGLEKLFRYCSRPPFALDRLTVVQDKVVYSPPKKSNTGVPVLFMTPQEFLYKLSALVPPPKTHRHNYHGVLAPNSALRKSVIATAGPVPALMQQLNEAENKMFDDKDNDADSSDSAFLRRKRLSWAMLLARIYEILPLICPRCQNPMKIISFVTETDSVTKILKHIGEDTSSPEILPPRGPPDQNIIIYD